MLELLNTHICSVVFIILIFISIYTNNLKFNFKLKKNNYIYMLLIIFLIIFVSKYSINTIFKSNVLNLININFTINNNFIKLSLFTCTIFFIFSFIYNKKINFYIYLQLFLILLSGLSQFLLMHILNIIFYLIIAAILFSKKFDKKEILYFYIMIIFEYIWLFLQFYLSVKDNENILFLSDNFITNKQVIFYFLIIFFIKIYVFLLNSNNQYFYFVKLYSFISSYIVLLKYTNNNLFYYVEQLKTNVLILLFLLLLYNLSKNFFIYTIFNNLFYILKNVNNFFIQILAPFYGNFLFFILPQIIFDSIQILLKIFHTGSIRRISMMILLISITYFYIMVS